MLQHANADMLLQRLQDPVVMQDAASVTQWLKDLEGLVRELCETIEADGESVSISMRWIQQHIF